MCSTSNRIIHKLSTNTSLTPLLVQSKFKDIILLKPHAHTWNHLLTSPPAGQLSFLIRAGAVCLPTCLITDDSGTTDSAVNAHSVTPLLALRQFISWMDARKLSPKAGTHGDTIQSWTAFFLVSMRRYLQLHSCMEISTHGEPLTLHLPQFLLAQHHHGKPDIVLIEDSSVHILVPSNPGKLSKSLGKGNKKL